MDNPIEKAVTTVVSHLLTKFLADAELIKIRVSMAVLSGLRPELKAANDAWLDATK